ncbi:TPA: alpha-galactosidase, partial [Candidatus Poribacteria bacterium]|nr:alpha-galactosidase [Candidatus Poribacteria bacterium]
MSSASQQNDWLVQPFDQPALVQEDQDRLILSNGLIARVFVTAPNFATIDYANLVTRSTLMRGIKPEAVITIDGQQLEVADLTGQPDYAY